MTAEAPPTPAPAAGGRGVRSDKSDRGPGRIARTQTFSREVASELRKVNYPSRQQLLTYVTVVLVFVIFMTALVSALDFGLGKAIIALFG
jgi:preprotein translocase subunit SecE